MAENYKAIEDARAELDQLTDKIAKAKVHHETLTEKHEKLAAEHERIKDIIAGLQAKFGQVLTA
jgi:vacuolar-type H+-ATPase subunit D/Vma8